VKDVQNATAKMKKVGWFYSTLGLFGGMKKRLNEKIFIFFRTFSSDLTFVGGNCLSSPREF